jgi:hypothetical protein
VRLAEEISIKPLAGTHESPRAELVVAGRPTGLALAGSVLEAAIEVGGEFLVFLTDDVPHEDTLSIHLVDAGGRLLDTGWIGGWYSNGSFDRLALRAPDRVEFAFAGDALWSVQVFPRRQLALPLLPEASGVWRPARWRRRYRIRRLPRA